VNTFISRFNSGVATITEQTTHQSVDEYLRYKFIGRTQFDNLGGASIEMIVPEPPPAQEPPPKKKKAADSE